MSFTEQEFSTAVSDFVEDSMQGFTNLMWQERGFETSLGTVKTAFTWGGEGEGEDCGIVLEHVDSGRTFVVEGYYASYDGYSFDDRSFTEVKRVTVSVDRYQSLDGKYTVSEDIS